ncbi:hypothetical protein L4C36_22610 [Photobacterium japonica]|uniref:hypothetical protein n=1 Tax=Photobacterium japonica TaxID=2910235 RepID=UPI003D1204D9
MPKIRLSGPALVDSGKNNEDGTIVLVTDSDVLTSLNGLVYDDEMFSDYLADSEAFAEIADIVSGGILRFQYDPSSESLVGDIDYEVARGLSDEESAMLVEYTVDQLVEGIGSSFSQERLLNGLVAPFMHDEELVVIQSH